MGFGLVAIDTMIERLADDHRHARLLAEGLAQIEGVHVDPNTIQTNIVYFGVPAGTGHRIAGALRERGVLINPGDSELRMVTHYGIERGDIDAALRATEQAVATLREPAASVAV